MPFTNRAVLCKSFHILLIINQFTPTSIFLHFQGLVAGQKVMKRNAKAKLLNSNYYHADYQYITNYFPTKFL